MSSHASATPRGPVLFVTSNRGKFEEAERILKSFGLNIAHKSISYPEVRADSCAAVARASALVVYEKLGRPLFVEDSGLFVKSLNGFPGAYSSWVFRKLGNRGVLRLLEGVKERSASFVSALAFASGKGVKLFTGECRGGVSLEERGGGGFGFDPIFIPAGSVKTFAEAPGEKERVSHRSRALRKLARWLKVMGYGQNAFKEKGEKRL